MIEKYAICSFVDIERIEGGSADQLMSMVKTAANKISIHEHTPYKDVIEAEIKKHATALFFKAKAIVADEMNTNGDYFSKEELKRAAQTFVGVPFYTNHNNKDIEQARGKIIFSEWNEKDNAIYVIAFVDREAYPHVCRGIEQDYMTGVSMGCSVEYSVCSICGQKAEKVEEYCSHIKNLKGRKFSGTAKDVRTGVVRQFKNALVYEDNYGVRFIELSGVGDPACRSCHIQGVFDNHEALLHKAASVENNIYMYRESSMAKEASQEEIQQLQQALATLEQISIGLIKNRQNVEVEFASDLVAILSDLQKFTDELVAAGYGQLQGAPAVPGTEPVPGMDSGATALPPPAAGMPSVAPAVEFGLPSATPMPAVESAPAPAAAVGRVSGAPGRHSVNRPTMPTPPAKPMAAAAVVNLMAKIAEKASEVFSLISHSDAGKTEEIKEQESSMKENEKISANITEHKTSSITNGGSAMSDVKTAARTEAPEVVNEKQLDTGIKYHPRTDSAPDQVTQAQLEAKRSGQEPEVLSEKQLDAKRTDGTPTVVTQKQLDPARKDDEKDQVTQAQLAVQRTDKELQSVTEKQLDDKPADVWSRSAFARKAVKTAAEHLASVVSVLAKVAVKCSATPAQIRTAAGEMVSGTKQKSAFLDAITSTDAKPEATDTLDVAARAKYWGGRGITIASATAADIMDTVRSGLKSLVASDEKIHPETVADVLEVVAEEADSEKEISAAVDAMMDAKQADSKPAASAKDDIRKALKTDKSPAAKPEAVQARADERKKILAAVSKPTHKIEASMSEIGITREMLKSDEKAARKLIVGFAKGAMAGQNKKVAAVTNVTIDGDVIQIAVSTDESAAEVEVPLAGEGIGPEAAPKEGDVTGENLDALTMPPPAAAAPAPAAPGLGLPPAEAPLPVAGAKVELKKEAQVGGGQPGTASNMPSVGGPGDAGTAVPEPPPAMDAGLESFTKDEAKGELPEAGEQMMPGAICPFCRSTDTTVGQEGREAGVFECNNCGAVYSYEVSVTVLNPENVSFEEEGKKGPEGEGEVEEPKLPEMPVAAVAKLDKVMLEKIASNEKKFGHVCPACGTADCKPIEQAAGSTRYICPKCETEVKKDIVVNKDDPSDTYMRIAWVLKPSKVSKVGCGGCKKAANEFSARVKVAKMIHTAGVNSAKPETAFPMANCVERIAKKYGSNAVATFGPCKGKPLTKCVCDQLEAFGLRKVRHLEKLASVYAQPDPMEQCMKDHVGKKYTQAQAETICNALKKKYATEADDNGFIMAFGESKEFSIDELRIMKERYDAMTKQAQTAAPVDLDEDIGAPMAPEAPAEEFVTIELPADVAADVQAQLTTQTEQAAPEAPAGIPETPVAVAAGSDKAVKTAAKPVKVENIEGEVEAKIPRGKATLGKEGPANIDVKENKPNIPEGGTKARMGGESEKNIDVKAELPDLPIDSSLIGGEKETQKGMPAVSDKIKGTVIAEKGKELTKEATKPVKVEKIEGEVEAGIPRGKATLGKEGPDNVDVKENKPNIPRSPEGARMGNEGPENIDVKADLPDLPIDSATMGDEANVQKGMPPISDKIKGTVIAEKHQKHMDKISIARYKKACQVVSKLVALGKVAESDHEAVIDDLSKLELERIEAFAERMFRSASAQPQKQSGPVLSTPIVQEASSYAPAQPKSLKDQLAEAFTVGSDKLNEAIREDEEK